MATTYSAIGEADTRNNARYLGVALPVIATAQLWSSSTVSSAPNARTTAALRAAAYQHALAAGFDRAFLVAAEIALLMLLVTIAVIRVRRADLGGS